MVFYNRVGCSKPKAAALILCREIWVKYPWQILIWDTCPAVFYGYYDIISRLKYWGKLFLTGTDIPGRYDYCATHWHGLFRVQHKVLDYLADLPLVRIHGPKVLVKLDSQVNTRTAQCKPGRSLDYGLHLDLSLDRLAALGEGKKLFSKVHRNIQCLLSLLKHLERTLLLVEGHFGHGYIPEDSLHQVVEIMSNAPCEGPDCLKLLGLQLFLFKELSLGNISYDTNMPEVVILLIPTGSGSNFSGYYCAVFP
jgi:hypothetical protein